MANVGTIRIQKALADAGVASRRKVEEMVLAGRVTVNGRPAMVGHPINVRRDLVTVDGKKVVFEKKKKYYYLALNKPRGYVTTASDELGRKCITELTENVGTRVFPVGRLDKISEGLILMTNDGHFANMVMHPSSHVNKTYRVTVKEDVTDEVAAKLSAGLDIGQGEYAQPCQVYIITKSPGRTVMQITIGEGKNRQIRRMCEAVGLEVIRLKRTNIGAVKLGMLAPGKWRELTFAELEGLRNTFKEKAVQQAGKKVAPKKAGEKTTSTGKKKWKPPVKNRSKFADL